MTKKVLSLCLFVICNLVVNAQIDYNAQWKNIDDLQNNQRLPQSALTEIQKVYQTALSEKNYAQAVKAIIYRMNCQGRIGEYAATSMLDSLKQDVLRLPQPARSVVYSIIAEVYQSYCDINKWYIQKRTHTTAVGEDISTWDVTRLLEEALKYYMLSISDEKILKETPLTDYDGLINYGRDNERLVRLPTLYDFVTYQAIQALSREVGVTLPQQSFLLDKPEYFADAQTFVNYKINTTDTLSAEYNIISLYQKLLDFRLQQSSTDDIFAYINVERLKYVHAHGVYDDSDMMYENALKDLMDKTEEDSFVWSYAAYMLAVHYKNQGDKWRQTKNDKFRSKYVEAYNFCSKIIEKGRGTIVERGFAEKLQAEIKNKSVKLTMEQVQYPDRPILALATYRNVSKLYIYTYQLTDEDVQKYKNGNLRNHDFIFKSEDIRPYQVQEIAVPSQADYQSYSAEIKIDALPKGFSYLMFVSDRNDLLERGKEDMQGELVSSVIFQVSSLNMVIRKGGSEIFGKQKNSVWMNGSDIIQVYLTDSKTGKPVPNAKIKCYSERYSLGKTKSKFEGSFYSDNEGIAYLVEPKNVYYFEKIIVTHSDDRLVVFNGTLGYSFYNRDLYRWGTFFTDRAIYRPGQTVYFKALCPRVVGNDYENNILISAPSVNVELKDVNGKTISSQNLKYNEYGTVQGSFIIPQGLLNGKMTLWTNQGFSKSITVEEYKRPTFEVKYDAVNKNYSLNDIVQINGTAKALAGYAVDNAKVRYHVVRNAHYRSLRWWFPTIAQPQREIALGETTTDSKGAFTVNFKAEADDVRNDHLIYDYVITADITDVNGETRSAVLTVKISKKPLLIVTNIPDQVIDREQNTFDLTTTNLNGDFTPADIVIKLTALKQPARILHSRLWSMPDTFALSRTEFEKDFPFDAYGDEDNPEKYALDKQIASESFNTEKDKKFQLSSLKSIPAGWYRLDITARNKDGVEVEEQKYLELRSEPSGQPAQITNMKDWLTVVKSAGEPNEHTEFWVGGGREKSYIRYDVLFKNKIVEQKTIIAGTSPERVVIPIKEEYRGGFAVQFVMVQSQRTYQSMIDIKVPYTNKQLDINFTTFREQLMPNEQEKWSLTVKNKQGEKEMAEMVATLYDASLDAFVPHQWDGFDYFYPQRENLLQKWHKSWHSDLKNSQYFRYSEYRSPIFFRYGPSLNMLHKNYKRALQTHPIIAFLTGSVRGVATTRRRNVHNEKEAKAEERSSEPVRIRGSSENVSSELEDISVSNYEYVGAAKDSETPQSLTEIATRQNFNETAFFYPQLLTNENGEILIEFTIPEALTRWKMLGFAHTKDFKVGSVSNELITQKQVAISANAPRFFREGDVIEFTAKVNNITENDLSGQALLRLYDATTMQPIDSQMGLSVSARSQRDTATMPQTVRSQQMQPFSMKAGESAGVKWTLAIPVGISAITYRLTAQAGNHTDGEEKTVPVLTNSMLVTETMPFSVRGGETKDFTFTRLKDNRSTTLRNHRLTLEFTSNPAWYAVQALPYLMEYPYECAEQTFSRFYANSLAAAVSSSSPRIREVFDMWRTLPESKDALLSNLEKNQELKQVMLEETPWVMQATNETERKKRVGLLFDLNRMGNEQRRAFSKLQKAQLSNGGFAWFDGLPPSRYITQYIVAGLGHLQKLNAINGDFVASTKNMTEKGLAYLDECIAKDYAELLKWKEDLEKQQISVIQVHYLYACSFSGHKPNNEAFEYYYKQAAKYWTKFNRYSQAMIALVLHRFGDKKTASAIIRSLKEHSVQSPEMGMYWRDNVWGYFWYQAPVETQSMMIEAFNEVTNDSKAVEEMKIWLLRNKQTNDWRTTKATAEACYALLMTGDNLLEDNQSLEINMGGKPLSEATKEDVRPEAGTGYVKTAWMDGDIKSGMAEITVNNPNKSGIAWGGVYWQYFEQLDKITSAETNLKMNKQLFLKKFTERGAELLPLDGSNTLYVGDIVTVRMELRADRDYEYVHLKDMRAAGLEPVKTLSGYRYQDGLWYYESIKDASTNFFFPTLSKGTYVFEYELRVTHSGDFSNGITTFQCMYAPEFSAHSEGVRVKVSESD
ncbi:MAG: hypothetical protein LBQ31_10235 [Bacteroidales bacterium]|jgi:uncharacterized protein YfaS (alpha-2-macroglobulin family)|nr:hypothetical protein [Bacteroidales bacterium]